MKLDEEHTPILNVVGGVFFNELPVMKIDAKRRKILLTWLVVFVSFIFSFASPGEARATKLFIPALTAKPGASVVVPVKIDKVDDLAGLKVVLQYDSKLLTYEKTVKSAQTNPLLYVVNDKKPGRIIVVMAGAKGIAGENLALFSLFFQVKSESPGKASISFGETQLMSSKLKEIKHVAVAEALTIEK